MIWLSIFKLNFTATVYADSNEKSSDYDHFAKYPIYNLRYDLEQLGITTSNKTISIFTFATGDKCHSEDWVEEVISRQ